MEIPMLNEQEFANAYELYFAAFGRIRSGMTKIDGFKPLLEFYNKLTGHEETNPNAIMHHRIKMYGPPCKNCGKPYKTSVATFCSACGHRRLSYQPE